MFKYIRAYLLGVFEFRRAFTTGFSGAGSDELYEAYDRGRDMAHRLTLRHWDV